MVMDALLLIVAGVMLLVMALGVEGWAWLQYRCYSAGCEALVRDELPFTFECSRGTVERQEPDGNFRAIQNTGDKNVGYSPIYHILFERNKYQYILEWEADGKLWRGHYPFLKRKGRWKIGDHVQLHYQPKKPWKYAVCDEQVWRSFLWKCIVDLIILFSGMILLMNALG